MMKHLAWLGAALLLLSACQKEAPAPSAQEAHSHRYSPFVVQLPKGSAPFDMISFKDVGVSGDQQEAEALYETLAESLSLELASWPEAPLSSQVVYSEEITDPNNHKSCGSRHIYVDVWSTSAPPRWGYSLWSGCDEESRFAWREVPREHQHKDMAASVSGLTRDMSSALRKATTANCFTTDC